MFSRKEQLIKKTGQCEIGRYEYLKQLINEFATSKSLDNRKQILANLANFAYDPINYEYMKQLSVIDLFLAQLSEDVDELTHFALAGLCNICCDPECREYINKLNGITLISQYLGHSDEEIALNALTTLFYLFEEIPQVNIADIVPKIEEYQKSNDPRFYNLGTIFLDTYYQK